MCEKGRIGEMTYEEAEMIIKDNMDDLVKNPLVQTDPLLIEAAKIIVKKNLDDLVKNPWVQVDPSLIEATNIVVSQPQIPNNATNGDVIRTMFPDWKIEHIRKMSGMNRYECNIDTINSISFYDDWWNAPYKGEK